MILTYRQVESLLDDAAFLNSVFDIGRKINDFVERSAYLTEGFKVAYDEDIEYIVQETLKELPGYKRLITKELRRDYIESCISSLDINGIRELINQKIIKAEDIDTIHLSFPEIEGYDEKIRELCEILGHEQPLVEQHDVKLVGVTFNNEDGSSRQKNLSALAKAIQSGEEISLRTEAYIYKPEIGQEEPAIRVFWKNMELGNIDKTIVRELSDKYDNPEYIATVIKIVGGDGGSFGLRLRLGVVAPSYSEQAKREQNSKNGFTHESVEKE